MQFSQSSLIRFILLCVILQLHQGLYGQDSSKVIIESISFQGQKRTRLPVMERELTFEVGDSIVIKELANLVEINRQRILNTNLFSKVTANIGNWTANNRVDITFEVREQWYLTGYWIFDLADRNFNVWWTEQNRQLNRVNYGFRVSHDNLTGNGDEVTAAITLGYTRKLELEYTLPAINKARTIGMRTKFYLAQNRETNFTTFDNKFLFHRGEDFQLNSFVGELGFQYRKKLDIYHSIDLEYYQYQSTDSINQILNADYFLSNSNQQKAIALSYSFVVDKRLERPYSKNGWYLKSVLRKDGLGIFNDRNALSLSTTGAKYFEFSDRWSLELIGKVHFNLIREKQPYFNSRALGVKPDFLRGYELYVIDGMDFIYLYSSLRYQILDWEWNFEAIDLLKRMRLFPVPLQAYIVAHSDLGFVNDPYYADNNPLSNEGLWSGGVGIDLVAYYDKIFQLQYSLNHLLESGIFLHFKYRF